uniref:Uncharacterized protein n=1 Tax=Anguilla anguilla TaxID=7936 RepID=A0A0E9V058_ANGAN
MATFCYSLSLCSVYDLCITVACTEQSAIRLFLSQGSFTRMSACH